METFLSELYVIAVVAARRPTLDDVGEIGLPQAQVGQRPFSMITIYAHTNVVNIHFYE
jgi:hypothetical protein